VKPTPKVKQAAELETYAGLGVYLEVLLFKFERHAQYYRLSKKDCLFQLQFSLTGTTAKLEKALTLAMRHEALN